MKRLITLVCVTFALFVVSTPLLASAQSRSDQQIVAECDRLAASPYDPERKAKGVDFEKIDSAAAINACREAVRLNATPQLLYQYGRSLSANGQHSEALKWYRKAADQRLASAQYSLGWMYANGRGVAKNDVEAVKWYRKAAEQGISQAQYDLGVIYYKGQGVLQNYVEAVKWFRKAADQGVAKAQYNLGVIHYKGQGVPQDYVQAHKWFNLAAANNSNKTVREQAVSNRDIAAGKMTVAQIAEAQKLAREWKPKSSVSGK